MKRFLCALAALLILSLPLAAFAGPPPRKALPPGKAGPPPGPPGIGNMPFDPSMMGMLGPMPFIQGPGLTGRVDGRAGYMWLNQIANFPFDNLNQFLFEGMTVSLKDAGVWVGMLGLDLEVGERFLLYGQIGGSIPRNAKVIMSFTGIMNPFGGANTVSPWEWTAKDLHWWMVDAGGGIRLGEAYTLVAGFRTEHLDYQMIDPRNNTFESRAGALPINAITCDRL